MNYHISITQLHQLLWLSLLRLYCSCIGLFWSNSQTLYHCIHKYSSISKGDDSENHQTIIRLLQVKILLNNVDFHSVLKFPWLFHFLKIWFVKIRIQTKFILHYIWLICLLNLIFSTPYHNRGPSFSVAKILLFNQGLPTLKHSVPLGAAPWLSKTWFAQAYKYIYAPCMFPWLLRPRDWSIILRTMQINYATYCALRSILVWVIEFSGVIILFPRFLAILRGKLFW